MTLLIIVDLFFEMQRISRYFYRILITQTYRHLSCSYTMYVIMSLREKQAAAKQTFVFLGS